MRKKNFNSFSDIIIVWTLCLLLIYFGKSVNMFHTGYFKLFISEFLLWLIIGSVTTDFFRKLLEKKQNYTFNTKLLLLFVFSFLITVVLWSFLYFPVTYFTDMAWIDMIKMSNVFLTFYTNCFIVSVWYFLYSNVRHLESKAQLESEKILLESTLKEAQLNALKGQINPHFMFNTLNNIRGLILEDPSRSRDMITRLSEMLRYSLTKNDYNEIKLEEELEMVVNYIQISKIQLEDRLQYVQEIAPETLNIKIPPMILQILVENAVKHGISNLKAGGLVRLVAKTEDNFLKVTVVNSGKLLIQSNSTQIGLQNILSRLKLLYGELAFFEIIEVNQMVEARVVIPLNDENGKN